MHPRRAILCDARRWLVCGCWLDEMCDLNGHSTQGPWPMHAHLTRPVRTDPHLRHTVETRARVRVIGLLYYMSTICHSKHWSLFASHLSRFMCTRAPRALVDTCLAAVRLSNLCMLLTRVLLPKERMSQLSRVRSDIMATPVSAVGGSAMLLPPTEHTSASVRAHMVSAESTTHASPCLQLRAAPPPPPPPPPPRGEVARGRATRPSASARRRRAARAPRPRRIERLPAEHVEHRADAQPKTARSEASEPRPVYAPRCSGWSRWSRRPRRRSRRRRSPRRNELEASKGRDEQEQPRRERPRAEGGDTGEEERAEREEERERREERAERQAVEGGGVAERAHRRDCTILNSSSHARYPLDCRRTKSQDSPRYT